MVNAKKLPITSFSQNEVASSIQEVSLNESIIVDFDETLLLRNSTAEYLNSLQPRFLAAILLKVISLLKPWKFFVRGEAAAISRDWFLVFFSTILLPWNFFLWQISARKMAKEHSNYHLIEQLNKNVRAEIIIATLGFKFIIQPILKYMPVNYQKLVGCRFWHGLSDRKQGKLAMLEASMSPAQIASATLITDSLDDLPALRKVAKPLLVVWDNARYNSPMSDLYFPLMYIHKVKRVGENYIVKSILFDDLPILLLALSWLSPAPLLHGCATLFFVFSFWCIYEYGYYENDLVAAKYESQPNVSDTYHDSQVTMNWWQPWLWSLFLGAVGALFLVSSQGKTPITEVVTNIKTSISLPFGLWTASLIISRLCFWVYNYVNKQTRIWLYVVLQFSRYCGFLIVTGTNLIGMSLIFAQILSRSISYLVYRYAGGNKEDWPNLQEKFLRWLLFILFVAGLSIAESDLSIIFSWQTAAVCGWYLFRGGQHLQQVINIFGLIQQDKKRAFAK